LISEKKHDISFPKVILDVSMKAALHGNIPYGAGDVDFRVYVHSQQSLVSSARLVVKSINFIFHYQWGGKSSMQGVAAHASR
jgi:hypothetical protein